jgi:hypothetical protein
MTFGSVSTHVAWLCGAGLATAIGFATLTVSRCVRSQRLALAARRALEAATAEARATADVVFGGHPDPLTCHVCISLVPLVDKPVIRCRHCGASVPIPRAYIDRARSQAERGAALAREASELHGLLSAGRPARTFVVALVLAIPLVILVRMGLLRGWPVALAIGVLVALIVTLGVLVLAAGQVKAGRDARDFARRFAAAPAPVGWACRICGAALFAEQDGQGEVCAYCTAENVVLSRHAGANRETAESAWTLGPSIAHLRAERDAWIWTAAQVPALLLAASAAGLLLALLLGD